MSYDAECYCATNDGVPCVFCEIETNSRLDKLGRNLKIVAAIERGFRLGNINGWDEAAISEGYRGAGSWTPGCGRSAP